jgi:hypothetical protein
MSIFVGWITAFSQPFGEAVKNYQIIKQDYENSIGEQSSTVFKYDRHGNLLKAVWSYNDNSRSSNNYYENDSIGNLVSSYRDFSDGLTSFEFFIYDSFGNKIMEQFYRSDSISGTATYQYENCLLKRAVLKNYKGWLNGVVEYRYNDKKQRKNGILTKEGNVIGNIQYSYDDNGNLVKEFWDFNGKWNQTFYYFYEKKNPVRNYYSSPFLPNNGNFRICAEEYTFNNESGGPSSYFYNDEGLLIKKEFKRSDGFFSKTNYEYDKDRKLRTSKRECSNGDRTIFTFKYDENNNLIAKYFYNADTLAGFESYLYNSEGELIKAYFKNSDNWLTGTISFESNLLGLVTHGKFKGQDGFDATIKFNYSSQSQLSEIKWDFSFGKFQQYFFKYEPTDAP